MRAADAFLSIIHEWICLSKQRGKRVACLPWIQAAMAAVASCAAGQQVCRLSSLGIKFRCHVCPSTGDRRSHQPHCCRCYCRRGGRDMQAARMMMIMTTTTAAAPAIQLAASSALPLLFSFCSSSRLRLSDCIPRSLDPHTLFMSSGTRERDLPLVVPLQERERENSTPAKHDETIECSLVEAGAREREKGIQKRFRESEGEGGGSRSEAGK